MASEAEAPTAAEVAQYKAWVQVIAAGVFRGLAMWSLVAGLIGFLLVLLEHA